MKQLFIIAICLIISNCGSQIGENKYSEGVCDCNELFLSPDGIWRLNDTPYSGKCIAYHQNGNKESESEFMEGKMNGYTISYYRNGNIEESVEWKSGIASGKVKYYYETGQITEEGQVVNESKEGIWKAYYSNGQIESIENYKNNVLTDSFIGYYMNGNIEMIGFWENGVQDGKWTFYDSISGKVEGYLIYENGKPIEKIEAEEY
jgi:antitoxin component YwqK of YwqJK toxin-antitoxin module